MQTGARLEHREIDKTITYGRIYKMKKLLSILVLGLLFCSSGFSVELLKENQKGKINFQSIPTIPLNQFLRGETEGKT